MNLTIGGGSNADANERRITGEKFLAQLKAVWGEHILCMNMCTDVLMYMDRIVQSSGNRPPIFATCMGLFRDQVLRVKLDKTTHNASTIDITTNVVLDMIQMEREGDVIDKTLIRSIVHMFEELYEDTEERPHEKLYLTVFEPLFLKASREFYTQECEKLFLNANCSTWLHQTAKRLREEEDRCSTTLSGELTRSKIADVVQDALIKSHLHEFMALPGSGLKAMIENDRYEDLTLLYDHIKRSDPQKEALKNSLQGRVMDMGYAIEKNTSTMEDSPKPREDGEKAKKSSAQAAAAQQTDAAIRWVDEVLALKSKFDTIWKTSFREDLIVNPSITRAFQDFINQYSRSSEYLSLFVDSNLKSGVKGRTEAEIDGVLTKATTLLTYILDKDLFERYYKKHLARRLLHGKSESADVEKQMIARMKLVVGNMFTSKLEGMFKDMTISEEISSSYRSHIRDIGDESESKSIDLDIKTLTSNNWPLEVMGIAPLKKDGENKSIIWPAEIKRLQDSFTTFYISRHSGRKLTWCPFIGSADVKCFFPKIEGKDGAVGKDRRYELTVPTAGMIILLHFNELEAGAALTFEEIQELTNLESRDLVRLMTTLSVVPKAQVLTKEPANKQVKPGDKFLFNERFTSKTMKIKAPVISGINKVEVGEERKQTLEKNDGDRGMIVDAAIVRTMKYVLALYLKDFELIVYRQRKESEHQSLVSEVITQLQTRFRPDVNMIKRQIENLIDKEYLERVEDAQRPTYRYLA